jgi:putative transposase
MITASTLNNLPYLQPKGHKDFVMAQLESLVNEFEMKLTAWVILDNHYHILIKSHTGAQLTDSIRRFHSRTSFEINSRDANRGRQVWHNYWDTWR